MEGTKAWPLLQKDSLAESSRIRMIPEVNIIQCHSRRPDFEADILANGEGRTEHKSLNGSRIIVLEATVGACVGM